MSDELDFIPIEADDFEDIKHSIFQVEDGAAAAIAELNRLRDDLAAAFGFPSYEWHKAPHEVRAAIETIEESLAPISDEIDYAQPAEPSLKVMAARRRPFQRRNAPGRPSAHMPHGCGPNARPIRGRPARSRQRISPGS